MVSKYAFLARRDSDSRQTEFEATIIEKAEHTILASYYFHFLVKARGVVILLVSPSQDLILRDQKTVAIISSW